MIPKCRWRTLSSLVGSREPGHLCLKLALEKVKLLVKVIDSLIVCLHWRRLACGVNPDYDLVLERMRQLVSSKQHILVAVKLHADDVANGMVFPLNREGSSVNDLRVPLIRNPRLTSREDFSTLQKT